MPRGTYRRVLCAATLLIGALAVAAVVRAEDAAAAAPSGASSTNMFERFFYNKDTVGCVLLWALILTSVVNVALIVMNALRARASVIIPEDLALTVEQLLQEKKYREAMDLTATDPSIFAKLMRETLGQATFGYAAMVQTLEDTAALVSAERVRAIEPLNVLGAVGPMAGVVGTVYGMIQAFSDRAMKPEMLRMSIGVAMQCTFWGLVIAVPAVVSYGFIRTKIEGLTDEAMGRAARLIAPFRPPAARRTGVTTGTPVGSPSTGRPSAPPASPAPAVGAAGA